MLAMKHIAVEQHVNALKWIAENENVARAIESVDEHHDILYHLFLQLGDGVSAVSRFSLTNLDTNNGSINIDWSTSYVQLNNSSNRLSLAGDRVLEFVLSFIGSHDDLKFGGDSFISYAGK